ncbi:hypothetical protein GN244_ATG07166 [Phytophthora infestans]|uniref:Uncharacterized protein n=1 Tax=Phytophthora infestans TaxID=4787 RepID=A0A833WFW7_PHYIN|nr:hypothetical protein GN244_ATG07166 [Phytophthora infestans]
MLIHDCHRGSHDKAAYQQRVDPCAVLSYKWFCQEVELLQRRSHEVASEQDAGDTKLVATWEWRHGNRQHLDEDSYLVSTGNVRQLGRDEDEKSGKELTGDIDELLLDEEGIMTADDEAHATLQRDSAFQKPFHELHKLVYRLNT